MKRLRMTAWPTMGVVFATSVLLSVGSLDDAETSANTQNATTTQSYAKTQSSDMLGDVNQNGSVTAIDATITLQYVVGAVQLTDAQVNLADVSGNGTVSSLDASLILRRVVDTNYRFPRQDMSYPLAVTIQGEGTVDEAVVSTKSEYQYGTTVRLTARADEGWEFSGWSGDVSGSDTSATVTVDVAKNVTATFEELGFILRTTTTRVESPSMPSELYMDIKPAQYLQSTFYNVSGPFNYTAGGEHYMFWPGTVTWGPWGENDPKSINDIEPSPSYILKRVDGVWKFWKEVPEVLMWGARNYKVTDEWVVIGDGNEIEEDFLEWQGDTFYGEFLPSGDIDWTKVNDEDHRAYYHGSTGGDLNGDGLVDVGGAPGWYYQLKFFTQNPDGSFSNNDSLINFPDDDYWKPFTLEFADVMGDEKAEIITADYGTPYDESKENHVMVFSYDEDTEKYELHFVSEQPRAFYDVDMGATSIQTFDFTGDGVLDLSIAREGDGIDGHATNSFEIWKGNGDGTFEPHWSTPVWDANTIQFREFWVFDVNGDDALDIILRPFHYGSFYRNNPVWWNVYENNGIKLHKLIWLNNGDGTFDHYDGDELKIEGLMVDNVHPYMDGETLHFMGTFTFDDGMLWDENAINLTTYDIEVKLK